MANPEHVEIVKQGAAAIEEWRRENSDVRLDLSGADMSQSDLTGADLSNADLFGAELQRVSLSSTDLFNANLSYSNLVGAFFLEARLVSANLHRTNLTRAVFNGANLTAADLRGAILSDASLINTNLTSARLSFAVITDVNLYRANFQGAHFYSTVLSNIDLSEAFNLGHARHDRPSHIDVDTLSTTLRSEGGKFSLETEVFFLQAGVPPILLEHLPGLLESNPIQFYSVFISYSTENEKFATALYDELTQRNIKTWKWNEDAVGGRGLRDNIDRAIRNHDKTIVVCSKASLNSDPVVEEIERALNKENSLNKRRVEREKEAAAAGDDKPFVDTDVLFPIRLDDYVFEWDSPFQSRVTRKAISDFSEAEPGSKKFDAGVDKLVRDLDPRSWPPVSS